MTMASLTCRALLIVVFVASAGCRAAPDGGGPLVLTPVRSSGSGTLQIVAPGQGAHKYTTQLIDTTAFASGGTLEVEVTVAADSQTDASFDIFPPGAVIPTAGYPTTSVAKAYDIGKGQGAKLSYRFTRGEVVTFGAQGNWFSPAGNAGTIRYSASVR
jgi:hypothetical protein